MAKPPTLGERIVLRSLWLLGKLGLGRLVTRAYMGVLALGSRHGMAMVFRGIAPTAQDVYVCTFSKSGTNWMMQIVTQIADKGAAEFEDIHDLVPWPEAPVPSQVAPYDAPVRSVTGLRAVKTHVPAAHVPLADAARYIVVLRDPKDVFVSSYHFVGGIIHGIWGAPPSVDEWHRRFVQRRFPLGSWAEHTAGWWALRERDNVCVLTFAELEGDLGAGVDRVAAFMDVELTAEERAAVVEKSSFAWMKAHAEKFATPVPSVGGQRAEMIRAGKSGSGHEELSEAQREAIDRTCREELAELGSDFPYAELFGEGAATSRSRAPRPA